jgi:hypothetical protein
MLAAIIGQRSDRKRSTASRATCSAPRKSPLPEAACTRYSGLHANSTYGARRGFGALLRIVVAGDAPPGASDTVEHIPTAVRLEFAAISLALRGQVVSGDAWTCTQRASKASP